MTKKIQDIDKRILPDRTTILYIGAPIFNDALKMQNVEVAFVRWHPPREETSEINALLKKYFKE